MPELPIGYFTDSDITSYRLLYSQVPLGGITCEVGSYEGRSLCSVADIIIERELTVHVVDLWGVALDGSGGPIHFHSFIDAVIQFGIFDRLILHPCASAIAPKSMADSSLDLVFIDADHRYDRVVEDLNAYKTAVKKGGIMSGHDYQAVDWPDVTNAVNQLMVDVEHLPDFIWKARL